MTEGSPLKICMLFTGFSMGLMASLIGFGSMILQTSINTLGASYIVAQNAARRITDVLMSVFIATGRSMATYCTQNIGASRKDRIRKGINAGYLITCSWCAIVLVIVYKSAPFRELQTESHRLFQAALK